MQDPSRARYGGVAQLFHWATAVLVLVAFIYGPGGREAQVYDIARDAERRLHETLGLCVIAITVLRVLWKMVDRQPDEVPLARWMVVSSKALQGLLYLLLIAVPVTAVVGAWLEAHPLTLLGGIDVAPLFGESHALGATIAEVHGWLGDVILWLAGLHAAAAIYHHVFLRDAVLVSMLPSRFSARSKQP